MKLLQYLAPLVLLVSTIDGRSNRKIDWSLVRPISEFPHVTRWIQNLLGNVTTANSHNNHSQRIVGGQVASSDQIPYQAAILADVEDGSGLCGGVLISANYVLTAAVCVHGASEGTVILGARNLQDENEDGQVRIDFTSSDYQVHEGYVEFIFRNNIAVIRLPSPVPVSSRIQPALLPASTDTRTFAGMLGTVSGFGRTSDGSTSFSDVLRYVYNPILTNADCNAGWWGDLVDGQKMCLSNASGRGPCVGDDGGPLTVQDAGQSLLVGFFSFGAVLGCEANWPAVFVRVTFYLDWIQAHTDVVIRSG
ncbi:brachyurin-like [Topomyia yanbarensis]|uniref:brachyurin-like n=1 Tax=Topomyia yanbarensis TaxID=2498891 RepID=UPI00273B7BE9|nr:brachyurin-like [Topomyia yanbarensis]